MILVSNLPRLKEISVESERVLDVGGWHNPFNLATHVIDIMPYATRRSQEALDPENAERFAAETWCVQDICGGEQWPWSDGYFDFSICSHTLEDVRDPLAVCRELVQVSRRGYIEVPSRLREIFCKERCVGLKMACGRMPEVGFRHHRWFCEIDGDHIRFMRKGLDAVERREFFLTRAQLGRKLTEAESGACLFWGGSFTAEEIIDIGPADHSLFRNEALARLRGEGS